MGKVASVRITSYNVCYTKLLREQALSIFSRLAATANLPQQIHYHYGKALVMAGDKVEAKKQLEIATKDAKPYPGLDDAKQLLKQL